MEKKSRIHYHNYNYNYYENYNYYNNYKNRHQFGYCTSALPRREFTWFV